MNTANPRESEALARADLLLLIADLLSPPWTIDRGALRVGRDDRIELLAAAGLAENEGLGAALEDAIDAFGRLDEASHAMLFTNLFEGAIPCPANESAYIRRDKGAILADICGFYRAFGFTTAAAGGEKADHIVCELQFVAMLLVMLADADRRRDEAAAQVTRGALTGIATDHLGEWVGAFINRLHDVSQASSYRAAATLLEHAWAALAALYDLPTDRPVIDPRPATADETPYECGMAAEPSTVTLSVGGTPLDDPRKGPRESAAAPSRS